MVKTNIKYSPINIYVFLRAQGHCSVYLDPLSNNLVLELLTSAHFHFAFYYHFVGSINLTLISTCHLCLRPHTETIECECSLEFFILYIKLFVCMTLGKEKKKCTLSLFSSESFFFMVPFR